MINETRFNHESVLLTEAIASLAIKPAGYYIDATFGRGGHSRAILSHLNACGRLLVIDKDCTAVDYARTCFQAEKRVSIQHGSFRALPEWAKAAWPEQDKIDGILFDLGISSPQIDDPERGFSFTQDGPLDMRMDTSTGETAAEWLAVAHPVDIASVLTRYGEERYAKRIAQAIVSTREKTAITRTVQLAELVAKASPIRDRHKHPATRTFQAIRIYINSELADLENALAQAVSLLKKGGRLVVISFHSLEDRITKHFIQNHASAPSVPRGLPVKTLKTDHIDLHICGKAIKPSAAEIARNPRARSAVLRVAEKLQ